MSMAMGVESLFTYKEFYKSIEVLIDMVHRETLIGKALDSDVYYSPAEHYIDLLSLFFMENQDSYKEEFYEYWNKWEDMVECAIISFVYGVCNEKGEIVAPTNHELRLLDESEVPMNSVEDVWKICTGQIAVKERFA